MKNIQVIKLCLIFIIIVLFYTTFQIIIKQPFLFSVVSFQPILSYVKLHIGYTNIDDFKAGICFDNNCSQIPKDKYNFKKSANFTMVNKSGEEVNKKPADAITKTYYLIYPYSQKDEFEKNIEDIHIEVGNNNFYYFTRDEILNFTTKIISPKYKNKENEKYIAYYFPDIKNNYSGIYNHFQNIILSAFSQEIFRFERLLPGFIVFIVIFSLYKEELHFEFNNKKRKIIYLFIICLALFLRIMQFHDTQLFVDELYSKYIAIDSFPACFKDAGNPPAFNIILFFVSKVFSNHSYVLEMVPFVFDLAFLGFIYLFFRRFNKNIALLMFFLACVNVISITYTTTLRSVSMCLFLTVAISYYLLKYLKDKDRKNLIIYSILSILAVNTHYYLVFYAAGNFIFGFCNIFENKKELLKFICSNIIIGMSFLPYFIFSNKIALGEEFNSWIPEITDFILKKTIFIYFHSNMFLIIFVSIAIFFTICSLFKNKITIINEDKKQAFLHIFHSLLFCFWNILLISLYFKPIYENRIWQALYGLLFLFFGMLITTVFDFNSKNKYIFCLKNIYSFVIFVMFCLSTSCVSLKVAHYLDSYIYYVLNDMKKYTQEEYEIYVEVPYSQKIMKNFPQLYDNKRIIWVGGGTGCGTKFKKVVDIKPKSGKKAVEYLSLYVTDINSNQARQKGIYSYGKYGKYVSK